MHTICTKRSAIALFFMLFMTIFASGCVLGLEPARLPEGSRILVCESEYDQQNLSSQGRYSCRIYDMTRSGPEVYPEYCCERGIALKGFREIAEEEQADMAFFGEYFYGERVKYRPFGSCRPENFRVHQYNKDMRRIGMWFFSGTCPYSTRSYTGNVRGKSGRRYFRDWFDKNLTWIPKDSE